MVITFIFKQTDQKFEGPTNHLVKRWFNHDVLNDEADYHAGKHEYALSDIMDKVFDEDGKFSFKNEPYVIFSSDNSDLVTKVIENVLAKRPKLMGLPFININVGDYEVHRKDKNSYDIVSFMKSPLLLREKAYNEKRVNYVTVKDDNFIEKLTEQTKKKLLNLKFKPLSIKDVESISFKIFHPESAHVCRVDYKDRWNIASRVCLMVFGTPEARRALYTVGVGNSTSTCFGIPRIINK